MCGIFGVLTRGAPLPPGILEQATRTLAHRGPDDSGTVTIDGGSEDHCQIGFAHTRLSIIDLSPLGHQPMQDPVTGNWIVYNGEIYNFRDIRAELMRAGVEFRSHSDTEVILAAYRVWGEDCFLRLQGMFALGLWDAQRNCLLLARDPMGIKPLYYYPSPTNFLFGSELRTLLQTGLVPKNIDPAGALSYLAFGSVYEPWTIVEGILALPAGHMLVIERGGMTVREYWSPLRSSQYENSLDREPGANAPGPRRLSETLREAVISHLVSDVPVGVFLSGGIDSSSLVAVMSQNGVRANTFSLVFREEEFNEARYSREIARRFHTEHTEIPVSQEDTLASLPEALRAMDQPTIDGINTYLVSAKARAAGVKVALTGLGADEMFAGYSNFRRVPSMERLAARLHLLPGALRRLAASVSTVAGKRDRTRKFAQLTSDDSSFVHPYFLARQLFSDTEQESLFPAGSYESARSSLHDALLTSVEASANLDPVNRVSYLESFWYMTNTLLRDSDSMSMAHGLELRVPFLDRPLVEACFKIPGKKKLQGASPKSLLLASLGVELPVEIVNRPKRGFTLPFERWLRGEMKPVVEEALVGNGSDLLNPAAVCAVWNRFQAGETSWSRPWSLFVLKRWCEQNL